MREKGKWDREDLSTRYLWGCKLRVREEHLGEKIATMYRRVDRGNNGESECSDVTMHEEFTFSFSISLRDNTDLID